MKGWDFSLLNEAVYKCFLLERSQHTPISGEMIKQKAKYSQTKLYPDNDFKASKGLVE